MELKKEKKPVFYLLLAWQLISWSLLEKAEAAAKHPPAPPSQSQWVGKKGIALVPIQDVQVLMPDQSVHDFGQDFQASLTTQLVQSGKYQVLEASPLPAFTPASVTPYDYVWTGSQMPSVTVHVVVESVTFRTGGSGDSMFYGFDDRFKTPFNNGVDAPRNEFPLRLYSNQPSWFESSFVNKGFAPFDSQSGLDLGDAVSLDFIYAFLNLKYAAYHSEIHLRLELDSPMTALTRVSGDTKNYESIVVQGNGFYFDIAGGYQGYAVGITLARKDAMYAALKAAIASTYTALDRALSIAPWYAKVDANLGQGLVLMGTGPNSNIAAGTLYQSVEFPQLWVKIVQSNESGSVAQVIHGSPSLFNLGMIFQESHTVPNFSNPLLEPSSRPGLQSQALQLPTLIDSLQLPPINLPASNLAGIIQIVTRAEALLKSIEGLVFLPYRLWRYFTYDQAYHSHADAGGISAADLASETWQHQIGLDQVPRNIPSPIQIPVVAVIDSGVDYNHSSLHDSLWINPSPSIDEENRQDTYGWDFISNDPRPYDDAYHGTQVASLVAQVAPQAKIMPLKVFNPWGITNSAAIYGAFQYAVDHGAQVILCAWATNLSSEALIQGIEYAQTHGVVVVTGAGDYGLSLSAFPVFPAVLSRNYDNVLTVTSVDFRDGLVQVQNKKPNYDPTGQMIQIAAPGETLWVAEPRGGKSVETSTGLAAAIVAGVLARNIAAGLEPGWALGGSSSNPNGMDRVPQGMASSRIQQLLQDAVPVEKLQGQVQRGARVRVVR